MSFDPTTSQSFVFANWTWNPERGRLTLFYRLDEYQFEEVIHFPGARSIQDADQQAALERCFELIHLLAGVSYYKAAVPARIEFETPAPPPMVAAFVERVYINGLGEFAFENKLQLQHRIHIPCSPEPEQAPTETLMPGTVVALGGGKDSLVSVETMRQAQVGFRVISVGQSTLIDEVAGATGVEHIRIGRRLSPVLFQLNDAGAYNGHVPISAILAGIMCAGALLYGYDRVVMSNEHSAEAANLVLDDGFEVNHQFSKSLRFEKDFQQLINDQVLPGLNYFSLLRPLSELEIARRFAELHQYHRTFSSCNANFRLAKEGDTRWCRNCPKCRFVFLALAPFLEPEALAGIFGSNLLNDPDQITGYRELLGLEGFKPFECVGEIDESRAALMALAEDPRWQDDQVISCLAGEVALNQGDSLDEFLASRGAHAMPADAVSLLDADQ